MRTNQLKPTNKWMVTAIVMIVVSVFLLLGMLFWMAVVVDTADELDLCNSDFWELSDSVDEYFITKDKYCLLNPYNDLC